MGWVTNVELKMHGFGEWCCNDCAMKAFIAYICPYCAKTIGEVGYFQHKEKCAPLGDN